MSSLTEHKISAGYKSTAQWLCELNSGHTLRPLSSINQNLPTEQRKLTNRGIWSEREKPFVFPPVVKCPPPINQS